MKTNGHISNVTGFTVSVHSTNHLVIAQVQIVLHFYTNQ